MNLFPIDHPPAAPIRVSWHPFRALARSATLFLASAAIASAVPSTTVVISQVYGGGGNANATYNQDFIELHNISSSSVNIAGWSLQYSSAAGTSWIVQTLTPVSPATEIIIPPGKYYLTGQGYGSATPAGIPLPTVDYTVAVPGTTTTGLAMAAGAGKVALVNGTSALTGASPTGAVDLVGYGPTAAGFETAPTPTALTSTTSIGRLNFGSTDTDNNSIDFAAPAAPAPRNSAAPAFIPSTGPDAIPPTATFSPNATTGVALDTPLTISFNEAVVAGTGSLTVFSSTNAVIATIPASQAAVTEGTAVFTLPASLANSTTYYVTVDGAAFKDLAGNFYVGHTSSTTWTFSTIGPDVTGPLPVTYSPANGLAEAPSDGPLIAKVVFDELITRSTGAITLTSASDVVIETLAEEDIIFSDFNQGASLFFATTLTPAQSYKIKVQANAFTDDGGFPNLAFEWTFTAFDISAMKVAVNKFQNNDVNDVVELLVIADGVGTTLDLQGMLLKDYSGSNANDGGGAFIFKPSTPGNPTPWGAVRAGTLIVLSDTPVAVTTFPTPDVDDSDFVIRVNLKDTRYFDFGAGVTTGGFNIGGTDLVQIKAAGSPQAGHTGAIHSLASGSSTAAQYAAAPPPKVNSTGSGNTFIINPTSSIADFNGDGTDSTPAKAGSDLKTFGLPNNATNGAYIDTLRGTQSSSVTVASASAIISETAGIQTNAVTISVSTPVTANTTVTLSSSPAGTITLPATAVIPSGSDSVTVSFTPVDDGVIVGNRLATISAAIPGRTVGTGVVTIVEAQYASPPVVINKFVNGTPDKVELLVIQDGADLRGMILKDFSGDIGGDSGGRYVFSSSPLWQYLPKGTLIVLSASSDGDPDAEEFDPSDFLISIRLRNSVYFDPVGSGTFDISQREMVMLKAAGSDPAGLVGNIHSLAGGTTFADPNIMGSLFLQTAAPKAFSPSVNGAGSGSAINNTTSSLADFNGTDVAGAVTGLVFGTGNNATNQTYIDSLRATAAPLSPVIISPLAATATVGQAFTYTIAGSASPTSFGATGLPAGLTLGTGGVISGTPTTAATVNVTLSATNGVGTGSATLVLTINPAAAGGYSTWATTNAGGQTVDQDFDGDGVKNGLEYFFGATGSTFTPNPAIVAGKIQWPTAGVTDLTYAVQTSTTLAAGSWVDVPAANLDLTVAGFIGYTLPASTPGAPKLFVRFLIESVTP